MGGACAKSRGALSHARLRFVGGLPIGCGHLPCDDVVSTTFLAVGITPVSGDCEFRRRARGEEYDLVEAFSGFQTFEWFLVLTIGIGTVVARGSHVRHNRASDVRNANVMILESDQYMACFDF